MVLFVLLVTTILLYDLVFNISCFLPEKFSFFLHLVASVLYSHVIMASISEAFPNFARLPYRLYIPSSFCQTPIKKWHANGVGQVFVTKIDSNLGVLQWAMLLLLCLCLQQFKTRHFHLILLSNLLYSTLKGLVHDNAHVSVLTVADCFSTNRKRVRCTQVNLQNSNNCSLRESISGHLV